MGCHTPHWNTRWPLGRTEAFYLHNILPLQTVDTLKRQTPRQPFNWFEQCLTCQHLQKPSRRQADNQLLPIPQRQSSDLDPTDPVKQTVSQVLPLERSKQAYEAKSIHYLTLNEPKGIVSPEALQPC